MGELHQIAYEFASKDALWPHLPLLLIDTDTGEILHVHAEVALAFGYTASELLGQPVEVLVPESLRSLHVDWRAAADIPKTRLMGHARRLTGRKKDGSPIPVHIGLFSATALGRKLGIAFVIDLSDILAERSQLS